MTTFDPWTATFEEAQAAHGGDDGPCGPLYQWAAVQELLAKRERIESGDGFTVLQAVAECARCGLVMPDWLATVFLRRYRRVQQLHVDSWDDESAFGRPYPKGAQLPAMRRRRLARARIANVLAEFVQRFPDESLETLFAAAGATGKDRAEGHLGEYAARLGVGKTEASRLYCEALKMGIGIPHTEIRKRIGWPAKPAPAKFRKLAGVRRRR
ncbi:MAG: hypothetical protein IPO59_19825 [Betaproteobacteria bacterium]|nr:hypothetical protein [Betaproteobacteria bacterium]